MSAGLVPLAGVAAQRFAGPEHFGFAAGLGWVALNDTEYHLSAHHMPLAVRILDGAPRLGAVLDPAFLARPQVNGEGRWQAAYMPIALRIWPFVLSRPDAPRPLDEIDVVAGSGRIGVRGAAICLDPAAGLLGPEMTAIRNTLQMMRQGADRLSRALDTLRISNVLVPLRGPNGESSDRLTVDADRLDALDAVAVAAIASQSFLPLDLAIAILFSRRNLDAARLPVAASPSASGPETPASRADPMDFVLANLETMNFALDTSDLFDIGHGPIDWQEFAPPPPPPPAEGVRP